MSWAPSAGAGCVAGQLGQGLRRGVDEDVPGCGDALAVGGPVGDLGGSAVRVDAHGLVPGGEDGARAPGGGGQGVGQGAHAADGDVPGAGAAADHVVEEAAVLPQ